MVISFSQRTNRENGLFCLFFCAGIVRYQLIRRHKRLMMIIRTNIADFGLVVNVELFIRDFL